MRISHQYKFCYLATPRTASTSIRDALDSHSEISSVFKAQVSASNPYYHHIPARELILKFSENNWNWDDYQTMCVARNPFDRVVSLYHHHLEKHSRIAPGRSWLYNKSRSLRYKLTKPISFEKYVSNLLPLGALTTSVSDFASDNDGEIIVKDVLLFENLQTDYLNWCKRCGVPSEGFDKLNSSRERKPYQSYYNETTHRIVENIYEKDIKLFNYKFE